MLTREQVATLARCDIRSVSRAVRAGHLSKHTVPHVGPRYDADEVDLWRAGHAKSAVPQPVTQHKQPKAALSDYATLLLSCPAAEDSFVAAATFNQVWARVGLDATLRNRRAPGEPPLEWPCVVFSPYHGREAKRQPAVMARWQVASGLTHQFIAAIATGDSEVIIAVGSVRP